MFKHLNETGYGYWAHAGRAWGLVVRLAGVQCVLAVHSIWPDVFEHTATRWLQELADQYAGRPVILRTDLEDEVIELEVLSPNSVWPDALEHTTPGLQELADRYMGRSVNQRTKLELEELSRQAGREADTRELEVLARALGAGDTKKVE